MPAETTSSLPSSTLSGQPATAVEGQRPSPSYEIESDYRYLYGTAGFRMAASRMEPVAYRVGLLAAAFSARLYGGRPLGIMLTASHNPVQDNGVKIVDPSGAMLPSHLESLAEEMAATPLSRLPTVFERVLSVASTHQAECVPSPSPTLAGTASATLIIGRDTRPSGPVLIEAIRAGAAAATTMGPLQTSSPTRIIDLGLVTTPELHWTTAYFDREGRVPTKDSYLNEMLAAYDEATREPSPSDSSERGTQSSSPSLIVDCAHGVGANQLISLVDMLKTSCRTRPPSSLHITPINTGDGGILNQQCGADFVKTQVGPPINLPSVQPWAHYASLDGDADRLVYFTFDDQDRFRLIDGDRMAALCALAISRLLQQASVTLTLGVVQTAYANGASTDYLERVLHLPVLCTPTGVKHLHAAAHAFDIGIYFEANGHGTILFSEHSLLKLRQGRDNGPTPSASLACKRLLALASLSNQLVGDGIADMLLVEAMLQMTGLGLRTWVEDLYQDRPSCLLKAPIRDRASLLTEDADRRIVRPTALQTEIDRLVGAVREGRAFVRASGTEDVVRVYAEAATVEQAQSLAQAIVQILPSFL